MKQMQGRGWATLGTFAKHVTLRTINDHIFVQSALKGKNSTFWQLTKVETFTMYTTIKANI